MYASGHFSQRDLAMSGHMYNGREMIKAPTDADAERQAELDKVNDELEGVERYNIENYELAKIQQTNL